MDLYSYKWLTILWALLILDSSNGAYASKFLEEETGWCGDYSVAFSKEPILYKSRVLRVFLSADIFAGDFQMDLRVAVTRWEDKLLAQPPDIRAMESIKPKRLYNYEVEGFGKYFIKLSNSKTFPFYIDVPLRKSFKNNALREAKASIKKDEKINSFGYQVSIKFDLIQSAGSRYKAFIATRRFERFKKRRWWTRLNFSKWFKKRPPFKTISKPVYRGDITNYFEDLPEKQIFNENSDTPLVGRCLISDFPSNAEFPRMQEVSKEPVIRSYIPPVDENKIIRNEEPVAEENTDAEFGTLGTATATTVSTPTSTLDESVISRETPISSLLKLKNIKTDPVEVVYSEVVSVPNSARTRGQHLKESYKSNRVASHKLNHYGSSEEDESDSFQFNGGSEFTVGRTSPRKTRSETRSAPRDQKKKLSVSFNDMIDYEGAQTARFYGSDDEVTSGVKGRTWPKLQRDPRKPTQAQLEQFAAFKRSSKPKLTEQQRAEIKKGLEEGFQRLPPEKQQDVISYKNFLKENKGKVSHHDRMEEIGRLLKMGAQREHERSKSTISAPTPRDSQDMETPKSTGTEMMFSLDEEEFDQREDDNKNRTLPVIKEVESENPSIVSDTITPNINDTPPERAERITDDFTVSDIITDTDFASPEPNNENELVSEPAYQTPVDRGQFTMPEHNSLISESIFVDAPEEQLSSSASQRDHEDVFYPDRSPTVSDPSPADQDFDFLPATSVDNYSYHVDSESEEIENQNEADMTQIESDTVDNDEVILDSAEDSYPLFEQEEYETDRPVSDEDYLSADESADEDSADNHQPNSINPKATTHRRYGVDILKAYSSNVYFSDRVYRFGDRILNQVANAVADSEMINRRPAQYNPPVNPAPSLMVKSASTGLLADYSRLWGPSKPQTIPPKNQVMRKEPTYSSSQ